MGEQQKGLSLADAIRTKIQPQFLLELYSSTSNVVVVYSGTMPLTMH